MKYIFNSILLVFASFTILSADTITLQSGENIEGQLLKVTFRALIIEVLHDGVRVETISVDREQVVSVTDESKKILYFDGKQQVNDLEDYYYKKYFYYTNTNGEKVRVDLSRIDPYSSPPTTKVFTYPHPAIEFGLSLIQNNLNQYQGISKELAENIEGIDDLSLRNKNNPLVSLNLGFVIKFSQYISVSYIGNFIRRFGDEQDYDGDTESFRLFLGELRYTFPYKSISPWIGVGYASQSITIINRYSSIDIKYKSHSNTVSMAAGIILGSQSQLGGIFSLRYLPFADKNITAVSQSNIQSKNKIGLSNIIFSASLFVNL